MENFLSMYVCVCVSAMAHALELEKIFPRKNLTIPTFVP